MASRNKAGAARRKAPAVRRPSRFSAWCAARNAELSIWRDVRAFPALAIWAGLNAVAAMILIRRFTDSASLKVTTSQIVLAASVAALLSLAARAGLGRIEQHRPAAWLRLMAACLSAAPIIALLFALPRRPGLGTAGYLVSVATTVAVASWLWNRNVVERILTSLVQSRHARRPMEVVPVAAALPVRIDAKKPEEVSGPVVPPGISSLPEAIDDNMTLWLKRSSTTAGEDRLIGAGAAYFGPGQSQSVMHVAFCPAFAKPPEFVCQVADGSQVRIKGTAVYPYGCRLELKRTGDTASVARVEIRFAANAQVDPSKAA